jgi:hypothetical protein
MIAMLSKEEGLSIFVAEGEMTVDELLGAYSHFLETGFSRLALWDLSRATVGSIDIHSTWELAKRVAKAGKDRRPAGRAAIVCGEVVDFGLARMLAICLRYQDYPVMVEVFADRATARSWLLSEHADDSAG